MSCLSLDPQSLTHKGGARFTRTGIAADAVGAAQTRVELGELLDQQFALGDERLNDLRLATYEALANAAEFAYLDFPTPGTMDLRAHLRFRFGLSRGHHQRSWEMAPARRRFDRSRCTL